MGVNRISGGIYLVIDPSMEKIELLEKLQQALEEGVSVVQIWDHWTVNIDQEKIINGICNLCHAHKVPVLINNSWELLRFLPLDGVHFDTIPQDYDLIRKSIKTDSIIGLTCNNNLSDIEWAENNQLNYISFCSIFPSSTSNSCDLVSFDTITKARKISSMPMFLAGGIQLDNMKELNGLDFNGIAIISGIMNSENPAQATQQYLKHLKENSNENNNH